jgi:oligosaccharide repeat unit polymerase
MDMTEISIPNVADPRFEAAPVAKERFAYAPVALFVLGMATLMLFFLSWLVPSQDLWGPGISAAIGWALFAVHIVSTRRYLSAFDPAIWVPVNMLLNYFGMVIAVALSSKKLNYDPFNLGTPPRLNLSFTAALLTLTAFMLGTHLAGWMRSNRDPEEWPASARSIYGPAWAVTLLGSAMIAIGIPIAGPALLFGAYGDMKAAQKFATADLRFFSTGIIILQCGLFALVASYDRTRPWSLRFVFLAAAFLAMLRVSIGDRAGLMTLALGAGWAYTQRVRRVPHWITVAGFIGAFLVMPIIGEFRQYRSVDTSGGFELRELAASTFYDMGSSLIAFSYTLEHIPRDKSYDYGLSIVAQLLDNIPNVGLSPGRLFGLAVLEHNPSKWLVATANPSKWKNAAGGYGYAVGAEWYFNFGMPGILIGMVSLGYLTGRVRNRSRRSPLVLTFASLMTIMMVGLVRNDFGYPFRLVLWPFITLMIFYFVMPSRNRSATPRR